jgi:response regulator RpfG family c-di-GMP phosphodiesterase
MADGVIVHGQQPYAQAFAEAQSAPPPPPPPSPAAAARPPPPPPPRAAAAARVAPPKPVVESAPLAVTLSNDYVETLNVLVSLLENSRPDLRGHSSLVARLVKKVCERMGLGAPQTVSYVVAAYLHDLGKAGSYHLTLLNVSEYDGHRTAAQKVFNVPERFFEIVQLSADTKSAVNAMYERFDGKGLPLGIGGKDIPLGARIVAVCDTYADLTTNPRNPSRRVLKSQEAVAFLAKYRGSVFDPVVLDMLRAEVAGDDLRARLLADRYTVLLVDPDPEETTVLELRLLEQGFEVRTARTFKQAIHELTTREVTIVISEIDVDVPEAGLQLRRSSSTEAWGQKVLLWIVHTRTTDREVAQKVFDLGVDDLFSKPTPPDVFVAKLRQLIERKTSRGPAPRGVSGSLAEMSLPDMVQVLFHGRKTCALKIRTPRSQGEIAFSDGQIVDARFGVTRGEDAFYEMLAIREGDFKIDPEFVPGQRTINASPEGLLLEGMRRMDEGLLKP